ncbi:hypothetical protein GWO43_00250 [candidate division KSB1 bacterium]|nr:hypothetical protein [candidate division KSB1 bacterium]NIR68500.1 hypothetical protein [candidate division KSB1 bacterium]NIS22514.1 hypothetical protein [candidate division KSB1 bacterium]NIT69358.1 hypothetical protein [candidate division KSB1 bacterium]NIU23019.1 hypothetical protein [candidate division KSB1 bacterium]
MKSQKETYLQKIEVQLNGWSSRIDELKEIAEEDEHERVRHEKELQTLNEKEKAARVQLEELKSADEDSWQDYKMRMDNAIAELRKSVQSLFVDLYS